MKNKLFTFRFMYLVLVAMMLIMTAMTLFLSPQWTPVYVILIGASLLVAGLALLISRSEVKRYLTMMGRRLDAALKESAMSVPVASVAVDEHGGIVWYNKFFRERLLHGKDAFGEKLSSRVSGIDIERTLSARGQPISVGEDRFYTVFGTRMPSGKSELRVLYLVDDTDLKLVYRDFTDTRISVMLVVLDNYEEFMQNLKESEKAQVASRIEALLENYIVQSGGYIVKTARDRFTAIVQQRSLRMIMREKFSILDQARLIVTSDNMPATLSIGVGFGYETLYDSETAARQALDMALGRGGDQAAVKTESELEFFGGTSQAVEKRTKVKTRMVAAALTELIENAEDVMIMGHRMADLDCVGAAVGVCRMAAMLGRPAVIAIDRHHCLANELVERLEQNGWNNMFVHPSELLERIGKKTLLIVVDTHVPAFLESQELYIQAKTVAVIDHHRKMVGHIDHAVIFYHEPYASSTAEMVTELVQYIKTDQQLSRLEAEALLAGIMLDTKSFVMKTGVRTFEAAAYLRKLGADTVAVKKLFSASMNAYQLKTRLVSGATVYRRCAIAGADQHGAGIEDVQIAVPQASDELLCINGVDASFVFYRLPDGRYSFSARSMGSFNVQLVMEALGGGGHLTMAGAQISAPSMEAAKQRLITAIDQYYQRQN